MDKMNLYKWRIFYIKWITGDEHTVVSIYHLPALVMCTGIKRSRDTSLGYFLDELLVPCAASMAWAQNPCCKRKIPLCEEQALPLYVYKKIEEKIINAFLQSCMSISFYFGCSHYWHGILFTSAILVYWCPKPVLWVLNSRFLLSQ